MQTDSYDVVFYVPAVTPLLMDRGSPGGAETQIYLLSRELAKQGAHVCLVAFDTPDGNVPPSVNGVDVVVRPPFPWYEPWFKKVREPLRIRSTLKRVRASVVVTRCAGPHVGIVGASAALSHTRFLYCSANVSDFNFAIDGRSPSGSSGIPGLSKRRDRALYRLGIKLADLIIVQTEEQVPMCEHVLRKKPMLIKSIVEPAQLQQQEPQAFLWVGRLIWYKRPFAFVELAKSLPDIPFRMVGMETIEDEDDLAKAVAESARKVPNLELLPPLPRQELLELMDHAVAIVNTADFEGMPNIFLEGWSRGIPALALRHDPGGAISTYGIGEFADGSAETLTEVSARLWCSRLDRRALAERCRRYVTDHHSSDVIVAEWLQVLGLA